MAKSKWLIVYCENDTSFSLIEDTDAVFDKETLEIGDTVKFFFNKCEYVGDVRDMGGEDDYDALKVKLKELNRSNKKKENSFHADRPRKTRSQGKYSEVLHSLRPTTRNKKLTKPVSEKDNKKMNCSPLASSIASKWKPLAHLLSNKLNKGADSHYEEEGEDLSSVESSDSKSNNESKMGSDEESSSSSPLPGDTSSSKKHAAQIKRKGTDQDISILKKLKSKEAVNIAEDLVNSGDSDELGASEKPSVSIRPDTLLLVPTKLKASSNASSSSKDFLSVTVEGNSKRGPSMTVEKMSTKVSKAASSCSKNSSSASMKGDNEPDAPVSREKRSSMIGPMLTDSESEAEDKRRIVDKKKKKDQKEKSDRSNDVLNYKVLRHAAYDDDVVEISGKSKGLADKKFYISFADLETAKAGKNASVFSKSLLVAAFSDEALFKCTLSGGQYRAGGKSKITQKPALPADVVAVIADVALHRQGAKKWKPQLSKKDIMTAMRQKLIDIRPRLRRLFDT